MTATAVRLILQNPLSDDPDVPRGARGIVSDYDHSAGVYIVDFGDPYGDVLCSPEEVNVTQP